ncbi:MAG: ATP-binding cassette domain-containing protein [Betaproteobacteria bacterium]|nr:ATP-binding cassette domain-containing protein [Betaproteobacteria bacterium]
MIQLIQIHLAFGDLPLLDGASLSVQRGDRLGLIGRNGSGKSSLLKLIAGSLTADEGLIQREDSVRCISVEQEPQWIDRETIFLSLLARAQLSEMPEEPEAWQRLADIRAWLDRFGLDADRPTEGLSGGERKRAALALAFALKPDLLLLDEPTNHLDLAAIRTLEEAIERVSTSIVITHDRHFLDRVVNRIVELERGVLRNYPGRFSDYQRLRADQWAAEDQAKRRFDRFWAEEEAWIRQGVEARRKRNQGRVRRLEALREAREARRQRVGQVQLRLDSGERSGKQVLACKGLGYQTPTGRVLVKQLDWVLMRGDRVALIGPNGIGKSTLIRLVLGQINPTAGEIKQGTQWQLAYFDQMREQLDEERSVVETISPGSDWIEVGGKRIHAMSYLSDFLFSPRRAQSPVKSLSGGERNRLLLARLFARPANLLILDEPTNDLDLETLELLESGLQQYEGSVLLVSHDRAFMDAVATQTLVALGNGFWREYPGGYSDWIDQGGQWPSESAGPQQVAAIRQTTAPRQTTAIHPMSDTKQAGDLQPTEGAAISASGPQATMATKPRKLSYKEQRELREIPNRIDALETEQSALETSMASPDYFRGGPEQLRRDKSRLESIESALTTLLERWEDLQRLDPDH